MEQLTANEIEWIRKETKRYPLLSKEMSLEYFYGEIETLIEIINCELRDYQEEERIYVDDDLDMSIAIKKHIDDILESVK